MTISVWQWLLATLLLLCFGSFGWGMRRFFRQPAGSTAGMKLISTCGIVFSVLHLVAVLWPGSVAGLRAPFAALLYLCALALFWWALASNRRNPLSAAFSPDAPAHLVEEGPYRLVRHPFYSSYLLTWIAGVVATANLWLLPTAVIMFFIYFRAAKFEEGKFSTTALAPEYRAFRESTGLFVPNPLKMLHGRRERRAWQ